jgi:hypothetical protein
MKKLITIAVPVFALCVFGIGLSVLINHEPDEEIRIEAATPTTVHPISGEFSTGYLLVEIWTWTEVNGIKIEVPHIVRMKRHEYIEYMNQPTDL